MPNSEWFLGRAAYLMKANKERNEQIDETDKMINLEWEMPQALQDLGWAFKQVTTIFRQVVAAAIRILADVNPEVKMVPYGNSQSDMDTADRIERAVRWMLDAASRRRPTTVTQDVVESAVRYSEVTQQVIFLPEQIKRVEKAGMEKRRYEAIYRRGPFVVITHNPKNVFARYSDFGVEEVALITEIDPHEVVDLYGDKASEVKQWIMDENTSHDEMVGTLVDYTSFDHRYVGFIPGTEWVDADSYQLNEAATPIDIINDTWKWPFLPWVARYGGSNLEERSDRKRRTMLSDAILSDSYETLNRTKTLRFSEMLRYAGSPKGAFQSDARTSPRIDNSTGQPYLHIYEDESVISLNPPAPDPSMTTLHNELRADVQKSTLSEVLFGGDIPGGVAFATINLVTHSAMAVLKPIRQVAEDAMADLVELMLLWIHYSQEDVVGYGMTDDDRGQQYTIKSSDIEPKMLYVDVKLHADLPTDRQQRVMTALNAISGDLMDRRTAREDVGLEDAKMIEDRIVSEKIKDTLLGVELENLRAAKSQEFMDQMMQRAMMALQQQMGQQQPPAGRPPADPLAGAGGMFGPSGAMPPSTPPTGMEGLEVPPEPNLEGTIPAEMNPSATRELQTGRSNTGEEIATEV